MAGTDPGARGARKGISIGSPPRAVTVGGPGGNKQDGPDAMAVKRGQGPQPLEAMATSLETRSEALEPQAVKAPPSVPVTSGKIDDATRQRQLSRMKSRATGLLAFCGVLFVIARIFESRYPWLGYVRATAEASLVGGLADWFAVTALFRHPLGIPIPHTAIIPARKDRIGRSLGGFVQNNFLSREVIASRIAGLHPTERLARWLSVPENSAKLARHVAAGLAEGAQVLRDEDVQSMIERGLVERVRQIPVAPVVGNVLAMLTADQRHQQLLDEVLRLAARAVTDNEEVIRDRIRKESPWWLPEAVDDKIHEKIVGAIERTLIEVSMNPDHVLRSRFDDALHNFIDNLKKSPEARARAEAIKEAVLAHPALQEFAGSIWSDVKDALLRRAERPEREGPDAIERGLVRLGNAVLADPALVERIDSWILDGVVYAVDQYRSEAGQLIADTVGRWDPDATSRKIELQVGKDLQFIRINGTLVGGLVGLLLYIIMQLT